MFCYKSRQWISQAEDGLLPADRIVALEKHLARCPECRAHRDELAQARRLLRATAPELPDNFEWKLQLRLNRTLQENAAAAAVPWEDAAPRGAAGWLRSFAFSAVTGAALTAALAVFVLPALREAGPSVGRPGGETASVVQPRADAGDPLAAFLQEPASGSVGRTAGDTDRRPLLPAAGSAFGWGGGERNGRPVTLFGSSRPSFSVPERSLGDIEAIARLSQQNARLRAALDQARRDNIALQSLLEDRKSALLDSSSRRQ